jgi:hypothetical protein
MTKALKMQIDSIKSNRCCKKHSRDRRKRCRQEVKTGGQKDGRAERWEADMESLLIKYRLSFG